MGNAPWVEPGEELFKACSALFGPEVEAAPGFFSYVQASGIKSAFRRVAMLTHPDHSGGVGDEERAQNVRRFIEAKKACDVLISFVAERDSARPQAAPRAGAVREGWHVREAERPPRREGQYHAGGVPGGKLRFGQFLYYSGLISYGSLLSALVWQRGRRVPIGEIAKRRGWLSEAEVRRILFLGARGWRFGEIGVRLGLISPEQLGSLLAAQRLTQGLIGQYFVQNRHISLSEINRLHREFLMHNARMRGAYRCGTAHSGTAHN